MLIERVRLKILSVVTIPLVTIPLVIGSVSGCKSTSSEGSRVHDVTVSQTSNDYDKALTEFKNLGQSYYKSEENFKTIYSACHKNPAAKDFTKVERLTYCYLPIEFRLCNSLALKKYKGNNTKLEEMYSKCAVSSGLDDLIGNDYQKKTYVDLVLNRGETVSPSTIIEDLISKYSPDPSTLSDDKFVSQFTEVVRLYVLLNGEVGGTPNKRGDETRQDVKDAAKIKLKKAVAPVFEDHPNVDGAQIFVDTFGVIVDAYQKNETLAVDNPALKAAVDQVEESL